MALTLGTAGPVLYWQGRQVRRKVPQLPECFLDQGQSQGRGPALRLVFLGDSIMAGIGHSDPETIFPQQLVDQLARFGGRALAWNNLARNGACSSQLLHELPQQLPEADLYVVSVGVNDALRLCRPALFRENLEQLSRRGSAGAPWLLIGLPNLLEFPCFPNPLRSFLAWRVRRLEEAALTLGAPWTVYRLRTHHTLDTFTPDLFHPGPLGCQSWARQILPTVTGLLKLPPRRVELTIVG